MPDKIILTGVCFDLVPLYNVSIGNTSINQNGQALEVIVIIMAVYLSLNLVVAVAMGAVNARVTRAPR